jgi:hypothetical protein
VQPDAGQDVSVVGVPEAGAAVDAWQFVLQLAQFKYSGDSLK